MAKHAILSPSGAHRWMACPGAPAMEQGKEDPSSDYADEGTAAHFLAAECLNHNCDPVNYIKRVILVGAHPESDFDGAVWGGEYAEATDPSFEVRGDYEVDGDLVSNVRQYVNAVRGYAENGTLLVEQSLPIGHLTGKEGAAGSGDAVILQDDGDELQVHDLKYGYRGVSPVENEQLMLYALGALKAVDALGYEPKRVRLVIHQPRVYDDPSEWDCSIEELLKFAEKVKERAFHSFACFKEKPEALIHHLRPSEEACQYCKAKAECPKLDQFVQDTVAASFEDVTLLTVGAESNGDMSQHVEGLTSSELSTKMAATNLIEMWIKAVRGKVESTLLAGGEVLGYKLVRGRKGARQWANEEEAEKTLKSFRLKQEQMYSFKLISPTKAEELLAKESPKRWVKLAPMIVQKDGGLSVAPESDKRPAWSPEAVAETFSNVTGEDLL